jgi:hypothetical protein
MRTTPGSVARQLGKFWGTPDRIDIGTAPRQWPQFWRRPDVVFVTAHRGNHTITLRPDRAPGADQLPLWTWNRTHGDAKDRAPRADSNRKGRRR